MRNIFLACSLLFCTAVFAQLPTSTDENSSTINSTTLHKKSKFSFGAGLSPTISWANVTHDDLQTDGATITGGLGLLAEYDLNNLMSITSGLNFNMPGAYVFDSASMNDITTTNNYLIKQYTLEIPLNLKFKTLPVDNLTYYTQGGLSFGYRIGSKELHRASSAQYSDTESSFNSYSNPFLLNYQVGFGASYNTNKRYRIFGEINYKSSVASIASKDGYILSGRYTGTPVPKIFSGNMLFTVGVMF